MRTFGAVQAQHPRDRVEHLVGDVADALLLQADVVLRAHAREQRDLLAPQPADPPPPVRREADVLGPDPGPARAQEPSQIAIHDVQA